MSNKISLEIKLCGPLSEFDDQLTLHFDEAPSISEIKEELTRALKKHGERPAKLIFVSAIANDEEIFTSETTIKQSCSLAVLPPVSGG